MDRIESIILGIFLIVFTLSVFSVLGLGFQGSSSSFSSDNKFDHVTGSDNLTGSSSFLQRFIGGDQPVANTTSSSFTGRFGILEINKGKTQNSTLLIKRIMFPALFLLFTVSFFYLSFLLIRLF